jgi:hypothetical protein
VRALTRRGTGQPRCIEIGQLSYDQADRVVKIGGQSSSCRRARSACSRSSCCASGGW